MFGNVDIKQNPNLIPDYLDKHFKEKEKQKQARKIMGDDNSTELRAKIQEMQDQAALDQNKKNVSEFRERKKQAME